VSEREAASTHTHTASLASRAKFSPRSTNEIRPLIGLAVTLRAVCLMESYQGRAGEDTTLYEEDVEIRVL